MTAYKGNMKIEDLYCPFCRSDVELISITTITEGEVIDIGCIKRKYIKSDVSAYCKECMTDFRVECDKELPVTLNDEEELV